MEKQELIEWLNNKLSETLKFQQIFEPLSEGHSGCESRANAYMTAINYVEQLDEPQKVKVPAFVAEWISKCQELNWNLSDLLAPEIFDSPFAFNTKEWLRQDKQNYDILARAWLDGYEVEEEPRWIVKYIPPFIDDFRYYSMDDEIFDITESSWTSDKEDAYPFTEKEKAEAVALLVDGSVEEV